MPLHDHLENAVARACRAAGGQARLARILGLSPTTLNSWLRRGTRLPAEHVLAIEAALGIPRHELRPDIYPPAEAPAPCSGLERKDLAA
jgi:DNA-binding transcriptional regulator YdaS (Cro superfamily)